MRIDSVALRDFPTPEGTPVRIVLADRAVRFAALVVDMVIIIVAPFVIGLLLFMTVAPIFGGSVAFVFLVLLTFFLRTPYFIAFELRWQGQTPGKRLLGIRVVDRQGGVLTGAAIVARNLIREVELFLPLSLLISVRLQGIEEIRCSAVLLNPCMAGRPYTDAHVQSRPVAGWGHAGGDLGRIHQAGIAAP